MKSGLKFLFGSTDCSTLVSVVVFLTDNNTTIGSITMTKVVAIMKRILWLSRWKKSYCEIRKNWIGYENSETMNFIFYFQSNLEKYVTSMVNRIREELNQKY